VFFFFSYFKPVCAALYRQVKEKECKDSNPQLFPVSSQCRAGSSVSLKPGLGLDWTSPGVQQLRAFYRLVAATSKFPVIPWAGGEMGKRKVVGEASPPSLCSICMLEISGSALGCFWKMQLLTGTQLCDYSQGTSQF